MITIERKSDTELYATPKRGEYVFDQVSFEDPRVWALICSGKTKGLFQIESKLGTEWTKKIQPKNINELAAVISLIRPGCLESKISEEYVKRKNREVETTYICEAIKPILKDTQGEMVFQEQILRIGIDIAGMSETDADTYLRKAIGKKLPEIIAQCREIFINGCIKKGLITEQQATDLFNDIEKFQRYGFNKCLALDTIVETPDGMKLISDIKINDKVLAPADDSTSDKFINVLDVIDTGEQEIYEITLESGLNIKSTIEHKHICEDGMKRPLWMIILENHKILCK